MCGKRERERQRGAELVLTLNFVPNSWVKVWRIFSCCLYVLFDEVSMLIYLIHPQINSEKIVIHFYFHSFA